MIDATFFEEYPLYRKFKGNVPAYISELRRPPIHAHCEECNCDRTFTQSGGYLKWNEGTPYAINSLPHAVGSNGLPQPNTPNLLVRITYVCAACNEFYRQYFLYFGPNRDYVMKVGQFPAWDVAPDPLLKSMLNTRIDYLKKGLQCEASGFGIGAFSYYRRVVEDVIDDLLNRIAEVIPEERSVEYKQALEATRKTQQTSEKIRMVKDLLPDTLRPGGANPLGLLYGIISEGLHSHSDEDCLVLATEVRTILANLVHQVEGMRTSQSAFAKSLNTLKKLSDKTKQSEAGIE